jgi:hypothetical protein
MASCPPQPVSPTLLLPSLSGGNGVAEVFLAKDENWGLELGLSLDMKPWSVPPWGICHVGERLARGLQVSLGLLFWVSYLELQETLIPQGATVMTGVRYGLITISTYFHSLLEYLCKTWKCIMIAVQPVSTSRDRVSLCNSGWPGTCCVARLALNLWSSCLRLNARIAGVHHCTQLMTFYKFLFL